MHTTLDPHRAARLRSAIDDHCAAASGPDFLADVATHLRHAVPFVGAFWSAVDPVTLLATSPSLVDNISPTSCVPFWEAEFLHENFLRLTDLARSPTGVGTLLEATDGRPAQRALPTSTP